LKKSLNGIMDDLSLSVNPLQPLLAPQVACAKEKN